MWSIDPKHPVRILKDGEFAAVVSTCGIVDDEFPSPQEVERAKKMVHALNLFETMIQSFRAGVALADKMKIPPGLEPTLVTVGRKVIECYEKGGPDARFSMEDSGSSVGS